jgi:hypothetical protein
MKWLRLHHDTPNDPKWRLVANDSRQTEANVLAVWVHMMVNASEAGERGTLEGWSDRIVAASLGIPAEAVAAIRGAMQGVVLDGDHLTGWEKRQRASDNVAERVKKHRAKQPETPPPSGGTGDGSADMNGRHYRAETFQAEDVTLQTGSVTEPSLTRETPDLQKESKGESVCEVGVDPREAHTQAPPVSSATKATNVVTFAPPGGRQPLPAGWVLPDEWRLWAKEAGQSGIDSAARRFALHWRGRGAKSAAEWREAWEVWVTENIERGYGNGQQRHGGKQKRGDGLVAFAVAEYGFDPCDTEGDPDDGGRRLVRG